MARSRWTGLRFRPSLDFARCRCCASLRFRRRADASHLIVVGAVDLANGQGRGLGLAHRLESGSIVSEKALPKWSQVGPAEPFSLRSSARSKIKPPLSSDAGHDRRSRRASDDVARKLSYGLLHLLNRTAPPAAFPRCAVHCPDLLQKV